MKLVSGSGLRGAVALFGFGLLALLATSSTASAAAEPPKALWQRCDGGSEDIACNIPRGVAASPVTGNVYITDQANRRVDEFSPWGVFLRTWGWDVVESGPDNTLEGKFEICVPANGDACKAGVQGTGPGQFGEVSGPQGIAIDSLGEVFVVDRNNHRVEKFDSEGHFVLMFGGKVNKTKVEAAAPEAEQNLCTEASGDVCQAGVTGTGNGQFEAWPGSSLIAAGPSNKIYVGDTGRIQVFDSSGHYLENFPDTGSFLKGKIVASLAVDKSGNAFVGFATSTSGLTPAPDVTKLSAAGAKVCSVNEVNPGARVEKPTALAVDGTGKLYVVEEGPEFNPQVRQFSSTCTDSETPFGRGELFVPPSTGLAFGSACFKGLGTKGDIYVSDRGRNFLRAYGPAPEKSKSLELCPKPLYAPQILSQHTVSTDTETAVVRASIDPRFESDTTYFVQYATAACLQGAGKWSEPCVEEKPVAPGIALGAGTIDFPATTASVFLRGLQPGTDYRYRFGAQSAESGLGEIFGVGGEPGIEGADAGFRTFAPRLPEGTCPNAVFRSGPAASLPDCRAYELVSPVDKEGADIIVPDEPQFRPASMDRSAALGERFTYSARKSFGDTPSAPYSVQYLATRHERGEPGEGWSTEGISPPRGAVPANESVTAGVDTEFKAFSEDLCSAWLVRDNVVAPPLALGAPEGTRVPYKRSNCGATAGSYEALLTSAPPHRNLLGLEFQGISADGQRAFYSASDSLVPGTPDPVSSSPFFRTLYEAFGSGAQPGAAVCALPSGAMSKTCSTGTAQKEAADSRTALVARAISADGSRVYWSSPFQAPSRLFVRVNSSEAQSAMAGGSATGQGNLTSGSSEIVGVTTASGAFVAGQRIAGPGIPYGATIVSVGASTLELSAAATRSEGGVAFESFTECTEASKACTLPVSEGTAQFWTGSESGGKAFFTDGTPQSNSVMSANLYEFDLEAALAGEPDAEKLIAPKVAGVMGASEDASHVYLVSSEVCSDEPNSEDDLAQAGEPNLYLYETGESCGAGEFAFIGTLAKVDAEALPGGSIQPPSPISVLGSRHSSRVTPNGSALAFMATGTPTGADNIDINNGEADAEVYRYSAETGQLECVSCNPGGARPAGENIDAQLPEYWAAARLPNPENQLYAQRALSEDGSRLFFESFEPLVSADTNQAQDVYEWEEPGAGTCTESSSTFSPPNGGCISLISSGESSEGSDFLDASRSGNDVFFRTGSSLLPKDPGLFDVYDARVNGGFPESHPQPPCEGEACQSPPPAPEDQTPSSLTGTGPGNLVPAKKPRCAKGKRAVKRKGKTRCVPKHHKRAAHNHRRAGR